MTSEEAKTCKEKTATEAEEHESKRVMVFLALTLAITLVISGLLTLFAEGLPLGFIIPILNVDATVSTPPLLSGCYSSSGLHGLCWIVGTGGREAV